MEDSALITLYKTTQTVFTSQELALLWHIEDSDYLKTKIYRLVQKKALIPLKRGLFALSENYPHRQVANRLISPSYISLHTILAEAGAVFQYDSCVYSIARVSREFKVDGVSYAYHRMKEGALLNKAGIITTDGISRAIPERAWLDTLYLYRNASVDNPNVLNLEQCVKLLPLYQNHALEKRFYAWAKHLS